MFSKESDYQANTYLSQLHTKIDQLYQKALQNPKNQEALEFNGRKSKNGHFEITSSPNSFTLKKFQYLSNKLHITRLSRVSDTLLLAITPEALKKDYKYSHINGAEYSDNGTLYTFNIDQYSEASPELKKIISKLINQASRSF